MLLVGGLRASFHKLGLIGGGLLLVAGFALLVVTWHFGVNLYKH